MFVDRRPVGGMGTVRALAGSSTCYATTCRPPLYPPKCVERLPQSGSRLTTTSKDGIGDVVENHRRLQQDQGQQDQEPAAAFLLLAVAALELGLVS